MCHAPICQQRELKARIAALADEWAEVGPSLVRNACTAGDVHEGQTLERCADDLRSILEDQ